MTTTSSERPGAREFLIEHMQHFLATVYDTARISDYTEERIRTVLWQMGQEGVAEAISLAPSTEPNPTHQYKEWTLVDRDS